MYKAHRRILTVFKPNYVYVYKDLEAVYFSFFSCLFCYHVFLTVFSQLHCQRLLVGTVNR
jgi:hypothetical protein